MSYSERNIIEIKKSYNVGYKEIADILGIKADALRMRVKRDTLGVEDIDKILKGLNKTEQENLLSEQEAKYKSEGKIIKDEDYPVKEVTIISIKGKGGLENAFYDRLYLDKLKKEPLTIKKPSSNGSEWFKIEVEGISMDDSTKDFEGSKYSLAEGDWAYCRSIPKINWRSKLHFNKVKVFCFFHNTRGIIFKKVKEHNIETGELLLTSLNPDKKEYPDFKINIAECSYICNVIKVLSEF